MGIIRRAFGRGSVFRKKLMVFVEAVGLIVENVVTLNPRPYESVSISISLFSAAMMLETPGLFAYSTNFDRWGTLITKEWIWALVFLCLAVPHVLLLIFTNGRTWRHRIMFVKVGWSGVILFLCYSSPPPFGGIDVLYTVYFGVNVGAYLQLYFGRAAP